MKKFKKRILELDLGSGSGSGSGRGSGSEHLSTWIDVSVFFIL